MARARYEDEEDEDRPRRRSRRDEDDEDDEDDAPPRRRARSDDDDDDKPARPKGSNGLATFSLLFGVLSFCTGVTFLPGLICGFMGLSKAKTSGVGKGIAIAGILTSIGGLMVSIAVGVIAYFIVVEADKTRERLKSHNNYKQVGLASLNMHDATNYYPKPFLDESVKEFQPVAESSLKNKLSWRVAILPYLEQESLYRRFSRSEPWDSSANKPLSQTVVTAYADTESPLDPTTRLRCFYGPGTMFEINQRVSIASVSDGASNTILSVEGGEKVTWSQFDEYKFDQNGPLPAFGHPRRDTFAVSMVDGSVRQVRKTVDPKTMKAAITRNGGEIVGFDW